jgi:biotin synthase
MSLTSHSSTSATTSLWDRLAEHILAGGSPTPEEALAVLEAPDEELLPILHAAYRIRRSYFGNKVKLNMIINAKSGHCPEDCGYCSQSIVSEAPISKYTMLDTETLLQGAQEAIKRQAGTYCIVASGRGPTERELNQVIDAVREIRRSTTLKVCACLGILSPQQAERLAEAGVHRYNHNLNTSPGLYPDITTTHTYEQRIETVQTAARAGMSPCSGVIVGMGESDRELVETAFALRQLGTDSIPVNFLNPIPGTPLGSSPLTPPAKALKTLALFRFICPDREIRLAGGREVNLRSLQPLALYAVNSIFVGDYLTTSGQDAALDHRMIADLGFEIEHCAL